MCQYGCQKLNFPDQALVTDPDSKKATQTLPVGPNSLPVHRCDSWGLMAQPASWLSLSSLLSPWCKYPSRTQSCHL